MDTISSERNRPPALLYAKAEARWNDYSITSFRKLRYNHRRYACERDTASHLLKKAQRPIVQRFRVQFIVRAFVLPFALLGLIVFIPQHSIAGDVSLLSIGPRYGFSRNEPVLGKRQTESFEVFDLAATFKLPWSSPLGKSPWSAETRLITSAGALTGAGDTGFIGTFVPDVALTGWNSLVSLDAGVGLAFLSQHQFGVQDFGGPVQFVLTVGLQVNPLSHLLAGFRFQHCSDAAMYGSESLGVDLYLIEVGYRF